MGYLLVGKIIKLKDDRSFLIDIDRSKYEGHNLDIYSKEWIKMKSNVGFLFPRGIVPMLGENIQVHTVNRNSKGELECNFGEIGGFIEN